MKSQQSRVDRLNDWLSDTTRFTHAAFSGHLNTRSLVFLPGGSMSVTFVIPPGQVDQALPLRFLTRDPLPLDIQVKVKESFDDLVVAQESHLSVLEPGGD